MSVVFMCIQFSTPIGCRLNHTEQLVCNKCFLHLIQFDAETTEAACLSGVQTHRGNFAMYKLRLFTHSDKPINFHKLCQFVKLGATE